MKKFEVFSRTTLKENNYFDGKLLYEADLTRDQSYLDTRNKQYGVVYGLEVSCCSDRDRIVSVSPGLALDLLGNEIVISDNCSFVLPEDKGVWDLFIEIVEDSRNQKSTKIQSCNAELANTLCQKNGDLKVWAVEVTENKKENLASSCIWLGRIKTSNGRCRIMNIALKEKELGPTNKRLHQIK